MRFVERFTERPAGVMAALSALAHGWAEDLPEWRATAKSVAEQALTLAKVPLSSGMVRSVRLSGLGGIWRDVLRGRLNTSTLFRFHAANKSNDIGLVDLQPSGSNEASSWIEKTWSFREIDERMDGIASAVRALELRAGSPAVVCLKNRAEVILIQGALGRIGVSAVSASWRSSVAELAYMVRDSGASLMLFDIEIASTVDGLMTDSSMKGLTAICVGGHAPGYSTFDAFASEATRSIPATVGDPQMMMYTSGTTGKPKGAVRTLGAGAFLSAISTIGATPMTVGEIHLAVCPLYHATAFGFIALSYVLGSKVIVLREFRPELFLEAVSRYRITTTALVPTMLYRIVELGSEFVSKFDLSSLKAIFCGGAPLSHALAMRAMDLLGDKIFNFYGATETGIVTIATPAELRAHPGTIGRAIAGTRVRLVDEAGHDCVDGQVGEVYTKSSMIIEGYHRNPDATEAAMRDGYFSVGDLGRRDAEGYLYLEGRKTDMIISGGMNIYPAEIEAVLEMHEDVLEAAVVGIGDEEWGERVRAVVVARRGSKCTDATLVAHARALLAGPKVPRDVVFVDSLPRNPTGKVLKSALKAMSSERAVR